MLDTLMSYGDDAKTTIAETALYYEDYPDTYTQNVNDSNSMLD